MWPASYTFEYVSANMTAVELKTIAPKRKYILVLASDEAACGRPLAACIEGMLLSSFIFVSGQCALVHRRRRSLSAASTDVPHASQATGNIRESARRSSGSTGDARRPAKPQRLDDSSRSNSAGSSQ